MIEKMPAIPDSGLRGSWLAELKECDKYRNSLIRRMKRAARDGDRRKLADLDKRYWAMVAPMFRPLPAGTATPWSWPQRYVSLDSKTYGSLDGLMADGEWDVTIPRRLRTEKGRWAWGTVSRWRLASEQEKRNLRQQLEKSRKARSPNASDVLLQFLDRLEREDGEFFSGIGIALVARRFIGYEKLKADLIAYRLSLNFSSTPGRRRHTIDEIKQIVAPGSAITVEVFRNMVRCFGVPFIPRKSGRKKQHSN
jgi:hypothetical protein